MAIIHRAFTFDASEFHVMLARQIVRDHRLRVDALYKLAQSTYRQASPFTKQVLELLRYDETWLDQTSHNDHTIDKSIYWYMIVLSSNLRQAPSLSDRLYNSHLVLKLFLKVVGWDDVAVRRLLFGEWLDSLIKTSKQPQFIEVFGGVGQFGGWLDIYKVGTALEGLVALEPLVIAPSPVVITALTGLANIMARDVDDILKLAYEDAVGMLEAAKDRGQDLFLVLD